MTEDEKELNRLRDAMDAAGRRMDDAEADFENAARRYRAKHRELYPPDPNKFTGAELAHFGFEIILADFVRAVDCWPPDSSAFLFEGVSCEPQNSQGKG